MRILQAVQALPPHTYGGSELYTASLAEGLAERGHDVAAAAPRGGEAVDVPVFDLPAPERPDVQADDGVPTGPVSPAVDRRFAEVLEAFDPDVVHLQHLKGLSATVPARCEERGAACVATLHDFWIICHREQLYRPDGRRCRGPDSVRKCTDCYLDAVRASRGEDVGSDGDRGTPAEFDGGRAGPDGSRSRDADDAVREHYRLLVEQRGRHLARALERIDRLVSPSEFLRDRVADYVGRPEDLVQLRNGIRVGRFEDTGFDGRPASVGYAGRIAPEKGVHLLVEAFERVGGDATLEVFGRFDPEEEPYHAHLAAQAGDGVRFHGWYADPATPYREMDVLVLPSVWYENSPLVIQEARAAGLPVVAADVGGMAELVDDGVDGLTFAVGDADSLAERLSGLVGNPTRIERLREGVSKPTRLDDHAAAVEALYRDCLSSRGLAA